MAPEKFNTNTTELWNSANGRIFTAHIRCDCGDCSENTNHSNCSLLKRWRIWPKRRPTLHHTFHWWTVFKLWQWIGKGLSNCGRVSFQFVKHFHRFTDLIVILLLSFYNSNTANYYIKVKYEQRIVMSKILINLFDNKFIYAADYIRWCKSTYLPDTGSYFYNNHCFYFVFIRLLYNSLLTLSSRKLLEQQELKTTRDYITTKIF